MLLADLSMCCRSYFLLLLLLAFTLPALAKPADLTERDPKLRPSVALDGDWRFAVDADGAAPRAQWAQALPTPRQVVLPHRWDDDAAMPTAGVGWYAHTLTYPEKMTASGALLFIDNPVGACEVYLDGARIDQFSGNGLTRTIPLTGVAGSSHLLAMRLDGRALPPAVRRVVSPGLGGVSLEQLPSARIDGLSIVLSPDGKLATVWYRLSADEPGPVTLNLDILPIDSRHAQRRFDAITVDVPRAGREDVAVFHVKTLSSWSPGHPLLYRLNAVLSVQKKVVDSYQQVCGVNTATMSRAGRLMIAGQPTSLKGLRVPGGLPPLAGTELRQLLGDEMQRLKDAGYNAVMSDGAVLPEELLDTADRLGILVIVDMPAVDDAVTPDIAPLIEQFGHHPCIMAWRWTQGAHPDTELTALRRLDPYRLALVRGATGTTLHLPSQQLPVEDVDLMEETTSDAALQQAEAGAEPYLISGTSPAPIAEDGLRGKQLAEEQLTLLRQQVEHVRRAQNPFGYFLRPVHGGTLTGLTDATGGKTLACYAALSFNQSRLLALRLTAVTTGAEEAAIAADLRFINAQPLPDRYFQLYRMITTPNQQTAIERTDVDSALLLTGILSKAFPPIPVDATGVYRVQYVLSDGEKVLATSQVVSYTWQRGTRKE